MFIVVILIFFVNYMWLFTTHELSQLVVYKLVQGDF